MNPQRAIRDIAHFEHLAVCDTRLHKSRRYVNHQAKPRESAPSLEESAEIIGQVDPLSSDAVNRAAGFEHVRFFERMDSRVVAIIGVLPKVDGSVAGLEHANLFSQGEIDGRGTELLGAERVDLQSAGFDFRQNHFTGEHGHWARDGTLPSVAHPYFDLPRPISIAHRGCAGESPENTIPAFERALAQGAGVLESDIHLTRDGVPILIHDAIIDRVTDASGSITDFTADELRRFDAGYHFSLDGGQTHPYRNRDVRIPSLEEAFRHFPDTRFNLDLKAPGLGLIDATLELVAEHRREAITLLTAGDDGIMTRLRSRLGGLATPIAQGASERDIHEFLGCAAAGTDPPPGPMALQIPPEFGGQPLVNAALIEFAHARGVQVHVWTINDPAEMRRLLDLSADGIITDYPRRLAEVIGDWRDGC
jgi:glycerophosphoryl diester phosphodiesterase